MIVVVEIENNGRHRWDGKFFFQGEPLARRQVMGLCHSRRNSQCVGFFLCAVHPDEIFSVAAGVERPVKQADEGSSSVRVERENRADAERRSNFRPRPTDWTETISPRKAEINQAALMPAIIDSVTFRYRDAFVSGPCRSQVALANLSLLPARAWHKCRRPAVPAELNQESPVARAV